MSGDVVGIIAVAVIIGILMVLPESITSRFNTFGSLWNLRANIYVVAVLLFFAYFVITYVGRSMGLW